MTRQLGRSDLLLSRVQSQLSEMASRLGDNEMPSEIRRGLVAEIDAAVKAHVDAAVEAKIAPLAASQRAIHQMIAEIHARPYSTPRMPSSARRAQAVELSTPPLPSR